MTAAIPIDDPADDRIADFRDLADRDLRQRRAQSRGTDGDFLIAEGVLVIRQLLRSPYRLRSILLTPHGLHALGPDLDDVAAPVYVADHALVRAICGFNFHRGALASADRGTPAALADVIDGAGLLLVAEGVNDNENLGALFRNAAAFGARGFVLDPTSADPLYRRSIRVSMGHVLRIPFARATEWPGAISRIEEGGYEVLALTPAVGAEDVRTLASRPRQALLLGSEATGLSEAAMAAAHRRVRIPLAPEVDSLNVATAAAIVLHQLAS